MKNLFEFASGTTIGRDHRVSGKNNHDSYCYQSGDDFFVGIVCDGCSDGKHSEVGAKIGSRLVVKAVVENRPWLFDRSEFFAGISFSLLSEIERIAQKIGNNFSETINELFLFTITGIMIANSEVLFFSLGDGVIVINGELIQIGPFPNNEPPYLAYGLVSTSLKEKDSALLQFQSNREMPLRELDSFLIGSDGAVNLAQISERNLPGKTELVGPISQFWENERYFKNSDNINRRLNLINRDELRIDWENRRRMLEAGLLPDDTTILVGRRKRQGQVLA